MSPGDLIKMISTTNRLVGPVLRRMVAIALLASCLIAEGGSVLVKAQPPEPWTTPLQLSSSLLDETGQPMSHCFPTLVADPWATHMPFGLDCGERMKHRLMALSSTRSGTEVLGRSRQMLCSFPRRSFGDRRPRSIEWAALAWSGQPDTGSRLVQQCACRGGWVCACVERAAADLGVGRRRRGPRGRSSRTEACRVLQR